MLTVNILKVLTFVKKNIKYAEKKWQSVNGIKNDIFHQKQGDQNEQ